MLDNFKSNLISFTKADNSKLTISGKVTDDSSLKSFNVKLNDTDLKVELNSDGSFEVQLESLRAKNTLYIKVIDENDNEGELKLSIAYKHSGKLDLSFNETGSNHFNSIGNSHDTFESLIVDAEGRIYAIAFSRSPSNYEWLITRYLDNGKLDTSFGNDYNLDETPDGYIMFNNIAGGGGNNHDFPRKVLIDSQGRILIIGQAQTPTQSGDLTIVRLLSTGELDKEFALGEAVVSLHIEGTNVGMEDAYSAILMEDDSLLIAGYSNTEGTNDSYIWKLSNIGVLDSTFGNNGVVKLAESIEGSDDKAFGIVKDLKGDLIIAGSSAGKACFWKLDIDGNVISDFNSNNSIVIVESEGKTSEVKSLAIDSNGKYVFVGNRLIDPFEREDIAVWRYLTDGNIDTSFASNGRYDSASVAGDAVDSDKAESVVLDGLGNILVGGSSFIKISDTDTESAMFVIRLDANGNLDTEFGDNKSYLAISNVAGKGDSFAYDMQQDPNSGKLILVGWGDSVSNGANATIIRVE